MVAVRGKAGSACGEWRVIHPQVPAAVVFAASDPDLGDSVELFRVDTLPENGTLTFNTAPVQAGAWADSRRQPSVTSPPPSTANSTANQIAPR